MILRRRWQVSAGLVWSGLKVGEGRETHLAARRRHSCAMPRRSAALAGRRRAGSSAACRPRVLRRPMQAPTPLGSRRRSEAGLGQAAGVSGWGVSRLSSSPRLNFVLPRSGCSSRRRLPASLARCRRCRRRVPPRAVAERSVAGAGRVAPGGPAGARSWCGAPSVGVSRLLLSFPRLPWLSRALPASPRGAGPSWVVVVGDGGDGRRRVELSDPTLAPRGASGSHLQAPRRRPRCSSELVV
jgi:hypothetical protein